MQNLIEFAAQLGMNAFYLRVLPSAQQEKFKPCIIN
jgi:hypothetical protein